MGRRGAIKGLKLLLEGLHIKSAFRINDQSSLLRLLLSLFLSWFIIFLNLSFVWRRFNLFRHSDLYEFNAAVSQLLTVVVPTFPQTYFFYVGLQVLILLLQRLILHALLVKPLPQLFYLHKHFTILISLFFWPFFWALKLALILNHVDWQFFESICFIVLIWMVMRAAIFQASRITVEVADGRRALFVDFDGCILVNIYNRVIFLVAPKNLSFVLHLVSDIAILCRLISQLQGKMLSSLVAPPTSLNWLHWLYQHAQLFGTDWIIQISIHKSSLSAFPELLSTGASELLHFFVLRDRDGLHGIWPWRAFSDELASFFIVLLVI